MVTTILIKVLYFLVFAVLFIVLTQDAQVYPGAVSSLFTRRKRNPKSLPRGVESEFIVTSDKKSLELWRYPADEFVEKRRYIGIVFHGNGGSIEGFFLIQQWFSLMGITSYGFDYRGFGKSSGWPSEKGIAIDSDAVWNYVCERERVLASEVIVFGYSLGGAFAARIASIHQPKVLVTTSAFTSIDAMIKDSRFLRPFARFSWNKLPMIEYVRKLERTHFLVAHGGLDEVVSVHHSVELEEAYSGSGKVRRITAENGRHNTTFFSLREELARELEAVL